MNKKSHSFPLLFNHSIRHRLVAFSILLLLSALFATTHAQPLHIAGSSTYYNELLGGSATNFGVPLTLENRRNTSVGVKTCSGKATGTGWIKFVQETNSWNTQWNGGASAFTLSGNTYMATAGKYDVTSSGGGNINVSITKDLFYTFIIGQNTTSDNDVSVLVTAQAPRNVTTMTHSTPQEGQAVTVTSTLNNSISTTSGNGAQYVYLAYSVNGGTYTSTPMTVTATNTVYTGTIPSNVHVADNTISYYTYITTVDGLTPSTTGFDFLCLSQSSVNTYNLNGGTSNPITIKAKRPSSWSNDMYLFFWGGEIASPSWDEPSKMNSLGEGWYSFTLPSEITASNILFRNGITSGLNNQSDDINEVSQSTCYNLSQSGSSKATASQVTCPVIVVGAPTISAHKATVCENNFTDFASLYVSDYGILGSETGYAGGITFLWERSTDNVTWTTFTDGRKATINNIRPTRTGYYRCKMTRFSTSTNSNEDIYSNVIQVTAGSNCTSRTVCSKLPVIVVQTNVEDFPTGDFLSSMAAFQNAKKKLSVDVKIIWDDTKDDTDNIMTQTDFTNPTRLYYDKKARMNYRGSSSLRYSKKNYAFTVGDDSCTLDGTWIKDTKKMFDINEVNKERDFILYAAYSDPTMMRNKLALDLYSDMTGSWNSKSRYVELYVNGEYKGVYIFMEKNKEDKGRLQVQEDGYIFKFDKTDVWDRTTSTEGDRSTFVSNITGTQGIPTYGITVDHGFEIAYPEWKEKDFTPEQWTTKWTYLRNRINDFENALKNGNYTAVNQYIDYESWADYFIMQEFAKNIDGYRISVWFTMETATSPIKMIPLWDNELAFNIKNITGKGNTSTTGLMVENPETRTDAFAIPFWWTGAGKTNVGNGLLDDNCFKAKVKERWLKHTTTGGALSQTNIRAKIDDMHTSLLASSCSSTPVSREFAANARWSTSWAADTTNINTWINPTTGRRKGLDDIISTWPTILSSATINTVNNVNLGDNVTFTATVTGTGTYTYAWYFCATNSMDKTTWTLLNANGTSTYEITNIQSQHDGYYHCIVTSTTCSCISETLTSHLSLDTKTLTVISANTTQGTVTGGGSYTIGSNATITALPKPGYRFVRWSDYDTNASRDITVSANATYIAYFTLQTYTITLQGDNGTFTGAGTYMYNNVATITAIPDTGYDFVKWSDNDTNASRSITVTGNVTLTATFAIKQYTVTLTAGTGGSVSGAGNYNHGQSVTIMATPTTGYDFVKWSDNNTNASRSITVTEDKTYIAYFEEKVYTEVVEKQPTEYIVYSKNQTIFVEAPDGSSIHIQDMMGRLLAKNTPTLFVRNSGIYFIHINDTIVKLIVN